MTVEPKYTDLHKVAVTGIVWRFMEGKRKYLITKRSSNKKVFPEKWTVPGGALETTVLYH
jgi:8-oxo-dGTP pyrophosphatase MutT (NUDIX family)